MRQMGFADRALKNIPGLLFARMLGSGKGVAFSLGPDWHRYALLMVWQNREVARLFMETSVFIADQAAHASLWTLELETLQAHGLWDGLNPFGTIRCEQQADEPVAVLTRASLHWHALPRFIMQARKASHQVAKAEGLLFSCGIGEIPLLRQATFSVWKDLASVKAYAYTNADHKKAIRSKHELNWYKEELFARFTVTGSKGTYAGTDPLEMAVPLGLGKATKKVKIA